MNRGPALRMGFVCDGDPDELREDTMYCYVDGMHRVRFSREWH